MKKYNLILVFLLISSFAYTQTSSTFTTILNGNWSSAGNWSNGIPAANVDATIGGVATNLTVDVNATCASLTITALTTMLIDDGITLAVNGKFTSALGVSIKNEGTIIINGNLVNALGATVTTVNGGLTTAGGVTFPNLEIE